MTAVGGNYQDSPATMSALHAAASSHSTHSPLSPRATSPQAAATSSEPPSPSPYLGLLCDVRARESVDEVFKKSLEHWGRCDVVANCSGYGIIGACEDQSEEEVRNQFEVNFFGTVNILQLSLPYFRKRGQSQTQDADAINEGAGTGGRYLIFSSTSGALGVPGLGPFCATKYAVEGLVESMLYETDAFDIRATLVEPGHVRRDDPPLVGSEAALLPTFGHFFIKPYSLPYAYPTAPAGHAKRMVQWMGDKQPTSAVKAAELVWQLAHCRFPPLRLLLGGFAVESVRDRLRCVTEEIEEWRWLRFKEEGVGRGVEGEGDGDGDGDEDGDGEEVEGSEEEDEEGDVKMEEGGEAEREEAKGKAGG